VTFFNDKFSPAAFIATYLARHRSEAPGCIDSFFLWMKALMNLELLEKP